MLLKSTTTSIMSADFRDRDLHLDVNSNSLPQDGPIEPKHVGNKNNLVYIYIYSVFYVGFQLYRHTDYYVEGKDKKTQYTSIWQ
jgi:hypothetical protein